MIGQFLRQKRLTAGLSQDAVAQALGYEHRSNVHRLETGMLELKFSSLVKFAGLLGVPASELIREFEAQN
jgi:transcriptional regulator with XRE-family HTH domain